MVYCTRRITEARTDVVGRQKGKIREDFGLACASCQHVENIGNAHPGSCDNRATPAHFRINDNALPDAHCGNLSAEWEIGKLFGPS